MKVEIAWIGNNEVLKCNGKWITSHSLKGFENVVIGDKLAKGVYEAIVNDRICNLVSTKIEVSGFVGLFWVVL